jgi:hypothetical protein
MMKLTVIFTSHSFADAPTNSALRHQLSLEASAFCTGNMKKTYGVRSQADALSALHFIKIAHNIPWIGDGVSALVWAWWSVNISTAAKF